MKALILGGGFIGSSLFSHLKKSLDVVQEVQATLNYTDRLTLLNYLLEKKFNVVINCSGYTGSPNVDACELNKNECLFYNVSVPVQINTLCDQLGIKFINVSSGCIYTGYEKEFTEKDEPNFGIYNNQSSYYSFTKHLCEVALKNKNCITLRIRMPFNSDIVSKNLIYKILKYDNILDLKNSGTNTNDFNACVEGLLKHRDFLTIKGPLNIVNPGPVTGKLISEYLSFHGLANPNWKIVDISSLDIVAQRSNCVLSDKKLKKLGLQLPSITKSLKQTVSEFVEKYKNVV